MIAFLTNWHVQMSAVLAFSALYFCAAWMRPRFGLAAASLFGFCALSAIYTWAWEMNRYVSVNPYDQMALRYFACDSIAKLMMIAVPMMLFVGDRLKARIRGENLCLAFAVLSSILCLWESRHGCDGNRCGGLIGNPSISMGLMASMLPVLVRDRAFDWPVLVLVSLAIFVSQSSIAVGLLAIYALFEAWRALRGKYGRLVLSLSSFSGIMLIGRLAVGRELTNDSDRFKIWQFMFDRWRAPSNLAFGTGIGTYHVFSINLQHTAVGVANKITQNDWWNSLHCDWLETLFWGGIAGVVLLFATYAAAIYKLFKEENWHFLMSAVLYGIYMFLDPALRSPIPILYGSWIFAYALRKDDLIQGDQI